MNFRTRKVTEFDVDGLTAELSFQPSCVMDYIEHKVEKQGGLIAVGYLVDDSDAQNPLEDCDGMGHIYSSHRHSGQHAEMQAALGLDSEWQPALELVEREAEAVLRELVKSRFHSDLVGFILECANEGIAQHEALDHFVDDFAGHYNYPRRGAWLTEKVREYVTWNSLLRDAWLSARLSGQAGDPYAVTLDCYEHGGQVWSISGGGMQCAFDTAHGAGVWVPDQYLREELDSIKGIAGLDAARAKATEFARQALAQFNAWLSGDCYGVAVDVFAIEGERLKRVDESAVWGYVGREGAEQALADETRAILAHADIKAA